MFSLFLTAILMTQSAPVQKAPDPIHVSIREASQHLLSDGWLFLRLPAGNDNRFRSGIHVSVVVDENGAVAAATAVHERDIEDKLPASEFELAEGLVRSLRFKPFERNGKTVTARIDWRVGILPPEIRPAKHVPFPRVKDWKSVKITLERTPCYGTCSSYRVELHGDGSVLYHGGAFVAFTGEHRGTVPETNVAELIRKFEEADYFSLRNEYSTMVTDNPTQTISLEIDHRRKQIVDYVGLQGGMPVSVFRLENAIDRLTDSERWTDGNAETVAALQAEHWNFKSPEAVSTLARVAQRGNGEAVRGLVRAGTPVNGRTQTGRYLTGEPEGISTLQIAAQRKNAEMLTTLLEAGAAADEEALASALIEAAESGDVASLRVLIKNGAGMNSRDRNNRTVLMAAAASGSPEMVKEVLKSQPDVNAEAHPEPPPCSSSGVNHCRPWAEGDGRTALMEVFPSWPTDEDAEGIDRAEVIRLLLKAGANVNARDKDGNTPLILCRHSAEQALLLLEAGADPNAHNLEGKTAFTNTYLDEVKRVLVKYGASPEENK